MNRVPGIRYQGLKAGQVNQNLAGFLSLYNPRALSQVRTIIQILDNYPSTITAHNSPLWLVWGTLLNKLHSKLALSLQETITWDQKIELVFYSFGVSITVLFLLWVLADTSSTLFYHN